MDCLFLLPSALTLFCPIEISFHKVVDNRKNNIAIFNKSKHCRAKRKAPHEVCGTVDRITKPKSFYLFIAAKLLSEKFNQWESFPKLRCEKFFSFPIQISNNINIYVHFLVNILYIPKLLF